MWGFFYTNNNKNRDVKITNKLIMIVLCNFLHIFDLKLITKPKFNS